ncbi:MAG: 30S ribosomal protein S11 [Patescibacteria group bacterium]
MGKKRIIKTEGSKDGEQKAAPVAAAKSKRHVLKGTIYVASSYNNTIVSVTDTKGEVFAWATAGSMGFKGARKSTPYAATLVAKEATERAKKSGLQEARIIVRGIGPGRDAAIRGIVSTGITVTSIIDDTPQPHNGVRPPKPRRV